MNMRRGVKRLREVGSRFGSFGSHRPLIGQKRGITIYAEVENDIEGNSQEKETCAEVKLRSWRKHHHPSRSLLLFSMKEKTGAMGRREEHRCQNISSETSHLPYMCFDESEVQQIQARWDG